MITVGWTLRVAVGARIDEKGVKSPCSLVSLRQVAATCRKHIVWVLPPPFHRLSRGHMKGHIYMNK